MDGNLEASSSEAHKRKCGGWISFPSFIGMVVGMSLGCTGMIGNLIVYLIKVFNIKTITATKIVNLVEGSSIFPIVAAIVADSFSGSFSVAFGSACVLLLSLAVYRQQLDEMSC